jgi:murein tripeptide amidase MpaA
MLGDEASATSLTQSPPVLPSWCGPGFQDYTVCATFDRKHWFRLPTTFSEAGALVWTHTSEHDQVYFAYFAPFR